jgi:phosphonate transport system substrate-binding protein
MTSQERQPGEGGKSVAFGVPPNLDDARYAALLESLALHLTRELGAPVVASCALSYDDLADKLTSGALHARWLPPALFVELDRLIGLTAVAAAERGGGVGYYAAFFTLFDSGVTCIEEIPGHSVGWVDSTSASGYVYPRLQLASHGIDPATAFEEEVFLRSHGAVVRAVVDRAVDVGATFVHLDPAHSRKVVRAGWRPPPPGVDASSIRWLEPFGPLPADVIAVTRAVPGELASALGRAFLRLHEVEAVRAAASRQFGTGRFVPPNPRAYELLRRAMESAEGKGVEVLASIRPSYSG